MKRTPLGIALLALSVGWACSDPVDVIEPRAGLVEDLPPQSGPINGFEIEVTPVGAFFPGQPLRFQVRVTANYDAPGSVITVTFPEVQAAILSDWGARYSVPRNTVVEAETTELHDLRAGQQLTLVVQSPRIEAAGLYSVQVSATSREMPYPLRVPIQNVVHETSWIQVNAQGGKRGAKWRDLFIPEGHLRQPGPYRHPRDLLSEARNRTNVGKSTSSRLANSSYPWPDAELWVHWWDKDANQWRNLPNAKIDLTYYEQTLQGSVQIGSSSQVLNAQGEYIVDCSVLGVNPASVIGTVKYESSDVIFPNESESVNWTDLHALCETAAHGYEDLYAHVSNDDESRVWDNFFKMIPASRTQMGFSRGRITVKFRQGQGPSNYSSGPDDIEIFPVGVWNAFGIFTVAHEYGHAVHSKALGGNAGSGSCNGHAIGVITNPGCAFSEGFADFHAAMTQGARIGSLFPGSLYELRWAEDGNNPQLGWAQTGSPSDEGPVAAFYLDLADPGGEDPASSYGANYVARIVKLCRLEYSDGVTTAVVRPESVVEMRICFMRDVANNPSAARLWVDSNGNVVILFLQAILNAGNTPSGWSASDVDATYQMSILPFE